MSMMHLVRVIRLLACKELNENEMVLFNNLSKYTTCFTNRYFTNDANAQ